MKKWKSARTVLFRQKATLACLISLMVIFSIGSCSSQKNPALTAEQFTSVQTNLRKLLASRRVPASVRINGITIVGSPYLKPFYQRRRYKPAWVNEFGIKPEAKQLVTTLKDSEQDGLSHKYYRLASISKVMHDVELSQKRQKEPDTIKLATLDLLLTNAYLAFASDLFSGHFKPELIYEKWLFKPRSIDLAVVLENALYSGKITESFDRLRPNHPEYSKLKYTLRIYTDIANKGGWPQIPNGKLLREGVSDKRVKLLKKRLILTNDLTNKRTRYLDYFNEDLKFAVMNFQKRNGLKPDGIVGSSTIRALNIPVEIKIDRIKINMEKWRWHARSLDNRYIIVNIPTFELRVIEDEETILQMPVIVGRYKRQTPLLSDRMTYMVLNPFWKVPDIIALEDKLPKIKEDPEFFTKTSMKVYEGWGEDTKEVDPQTVDWENLNEENLNVRLVMDPGPANALGQMKFMFPNDEDVYIHDTPSKYLFKKPKRTFSSGCIRIQKPYELADYLLKDNPKWPSEKLREEIKKKEKVEIGLDNPIPVYILYFTTWSDENGNIMFADDIYSIDAQLKSAMMK